MMKTTPTDKREKVANDILAPIYFMLIGGSSVCGWNAGMNCIDYFSAKYPQYNVSFIFPIPAFVAQILAILSVSKLSDLYTYNTRIVSSLITIILIAAYIPFEAALFKDTDFGVALILLLLFVLGFFNNLCYASIAGLTSQIEGKYTAYFLIGTAINSLGMNFLREATLITFSPLTEEDFTNVAVYFAITVAFLISCLFVHYHFMKSEFYREKFEPITDPISDSTDQESALIQPLKGPVRPKRDLKMLLSVLKEVKLYVFLLAVTYAQLLVSFPGLMLKKEIPGMASHTKTVTMFITFNLSFIVGKKLGQYRQYYNKYIVMGIVAARFILVWLFVAQIVMTGNEILKSVLFGYLNIAMFGLTTGFVGVGLYILGPEQVTQDKKEIAGFLSVFGGNVGLIAGAFLALPFRNIGVHAE